jgi:hypothetical protein
VAFARVNDVEKLFLGSGIDFCGDQRRPAKVASLGGFPVTLRTVLLKDRVSG